MRLGAAMKEISRAIVIAPVPMARLVLAHRPAHGLTLRHSARPLAWPQAMPRRDRGGLSDGKRAIAVGLLIALLALAMLLLTVHVLTRSIPAAVQDMRTIEGRGSCGSGDPGLPTRSEFDGAPARIGSAFAC